MCLLSSHLPATAVIEIALITTTGELGIDRGTTAVDL